MTELHLHGFFSYVDKYGKLRFLWNDDTKKNNIDKLARVCKGNLPYTDKGFTVTLPQDLPLPTFACGSPCEVYVKTRQYKFTSKMEKNYGDIVSGTKLILTNVVSNYSLSKS